MTVAYAARSERNSNDPRAPASVPKRVLHSLPNAASPGPLRVPRKATQMRDLVRRRGVAQAKLQAMAALWYICLTTSGADGPTAKSRN